MHEANWADALISIMLDLHAGPPDLIICFIESIE